ncbi:Phenylacetate-coenzyme A ligase [Fundidesulfovibrio magnetotacticus]|uniref:Phenylacetate-coenzyme A ligase n=1 Tax=Fundidesulfovibrio magnetotacticus TaxID=2730080 RepID=A0A6V8M0U1_9BACT|nr:AMP-binding protein [Fundidesulfovibrio magnetotacticus]GFK94085.1 Phenylacetate-coenzyme A ligase [Fundidesulfovibrio magnetotacticus]
MTQAPPSLEFIPDPERRDALWARLAGHLEHAFAQSSEARARMERAGLTPGDVRSPEDFARIPPLRKKDLKAVQASGPRLGGLSTVDLGRLRRLYQSPGPLYDPEGREPDFWGWTEAFRAAGFEAGDLAVMTFSYHLTPAGHMLEEPLRELGCAVVPAGPGNTEILTELLASLPVTAFVGMASFLRALGEKARAAGLDPARDLSVRKAFVAAERLPESLRREVQEMFGARVRQGYGTADVGAIAYECDALEGMHCSSRGWVEVCDPATGEPLPPGEMGEVVFTPFVRAYPLVRLATGDLSRLVEAPCPCGRTSPRLAGILGRADDTVKIKGQFVYPAQAAEALAAFPGVVAWRLVATNPGGRDCLTLVYEASADVDEAALTEAFRLRCKLRPVLERAQAGTIDTALPRLEDRRTWD